MYSNCSNSSYRPYYPYGGYYNHKPCNSRPFYPYNRPYYRPIPRPYRRPYSCGPFGFGCSNRYY